MPTSAAGNKAKVQATANSPALSQAAVRALALPRARTSLGFTLIELLVVIALIAIGTAAVSFSLRDSADTVLERDAERLAALFESARARSRASGMPVQWHPVSASTSSNADAFVFEGLPPQALPGRWLSPLVQVAGTSVVTLGPDPIIGPQSVALRVNEKQVWVSTDGLQPFKVKQTAP
jgi:general secretion pathway protein H